MKKCFLSMSKTFGALMSGRILLEDLRALEVCFYFGPHKEAIYSDIAIPSFIMAFNREKPKFLPDQEEWIDRELLDPPVADLWKDFKQLLQVAEKESRIAWTDGRNYPAKIKSLLEQGHEVYFDGKWEKPGHFKDLEE